MKLTVNIYSGSHSPEAFAVIATEKGRSFRLDGIEREPGLDAAGLASWILTEFQQRSPWDLQRRHRLYRQLCDFVNVIIPSSRERVRRDNEGFSLSSALAEKGFTVVDYR